MVSHWLLPAGLVTFSVGGTEGEPLRLAVLAEEAWGLRLGRNLGKGLQAVFNISWGYFLLGFCLLQSNPPPLLPHRGKLTFASLLTGVLLISPS